MARKVSELIELALIYAVQDREGMADAARGEAAGAEAAGAEAAELAKEFRAYHRKRFGKKHLSALDQMIAEAKPVTLSELRARHEQETP